MQLDVKLRKISFLATKKTIFLLLLAGIEPTTPHVLKKWLLASQKSSKSRRQIVTSRSLRKSRVTRRDEKSPEIQNFGVFQYLLLKYPQTSMKSLQLLTFSIVAVHVCQIVKFLITFRHKYTYMYRYNAMKNICTRDDSNLCLQVQALLLY